MKSIEKLEIVIKRSGLNQKEFAEKIGMNHIVLNRNLQKRNFSAEMMKGVIMYVDVDLNWLFDKNTRKEFGIVNEPEAKHNENSEDKINKAIELLEELRNDLSR
jgi:hypothetical protein